MSNKINVFWQRLLEADLVQGNSPSHESMDSPWYVKMLLAISGWLGAIFLLIFFFIAFNSILEAPIVLFLISLPLFFIAHRILLTPKNEFYQHLALALSLVGQAVFIFSIFEWQSPELICLVVALLQLLLICFMPSFLHRVFSTVIAIGAFVASVSVAGVPHILLFGGLIIFPTTWLCLNEFRFTKLYKVMKGMMYGMVIAMLLLNSSHVFFDDFEQLFSSNATLLTLPYWFADIIYISAIVFVTWQLLLSNNIDTRATFSKLVLLFSFVLAIATFKAPGIGVGLIVIIIGFAHSNRTLLGLGIFSLLAYSSSYYYMMEETLLFKSGILLAVAILMLVSRLLLNKTLPLLNGTELYTQGKDN
ncbi:MAG: DUF4401 domain-containing protein [Colwellia sp.]|nr:DUF4401 domain-containing protein [Colwellia sp.]